jgi:hypothetical protein
MPLGRDVLASWSSSYGKRRPGERHLVAWQRTGGTRERGEREGGGRKGRGWRVEEEEKGKERKEEGEEGDVGEAALALLMRDERALRPRRDSNPNLTWCVE